MITQAQIYAALQTWIKRESGYSNVIQARQSQARPQLPYGSVLVIVAGVRVGGIDETRGQATTTLGQPDYVFTLEGLRTCLVSVNFYGKGANETLSKVRDSMDRADVIEEMSRAGISILSDDGPRDLTELENTVYTERAQIDFTVQYAMVRDTPIQPILEIEMDGVLITDQDTEITTDIIEVETTLP